jgi:transposase
MIAAADLEVIPQNIREYINDLENNILILKERLDLLVYRKFARSAEQLIHTGQGELFNETETVQEKPEEEHDSEEIKSYVRKKRGRKALDSSLPRVEKIIDITEEEKTCGCGARLVKIGEETSEKLHIIPQKIYVEKTIRIKYACPECEGTEDEGNPVVRIAPVEPSILSRSIASADLLSYIIVQKYCDHLPYYRQEKQFERIGASISRQDMSNWQKQAWEKLEPLYHLMKKALQSGPVMQLDETTVQVMGEEGRSDTQKSYMWLARGGPPEKPVVLYEYHPTRGSVHAKGFLEGFSGYVQSDGYDGYDAAVAGRKDIIHVGCFAHARRRFFEASKISKKPQSAEEGMKYIRKLYQIEDKLRQRNMEGQAFLEERKKEAEPVLATFKAWLDKRVQEVPPSLLLGKAINYTINQWDKLAAYLGSPYLTPDNNACENAIRPFVLGRKNWLFNKSPEGAESSCGMYSLIETARQNGLQPLEYLRTIFERCPLAKTQEDWEKLLPWNISTA